MSHVPKVSVLAWIVELGFIVSICRRQFTHTHPETIAGTWSKNWGLREKGECQRCPTGVVCPLDGMTIPCSYNDLPTPYEPIVRDFKGMAALEYLFPVDSRPPPFSMYECLALNSGAEFSSNIEYFFGELIPPYIDILGRGPHFRPSDQSSLKYQSEAKCYKNSQPQGSLVYKRMSDYYGPQYDIQTGYPHQGYGIDLLHSQIFATAPPAGYDFSFEYFRGEGNGFIDLPKARVYDPAFNCTKGIMLMNSSLVMEETLVAYTDPVHDYEGGYDIEKCSTFDLELDCYIDDAYELHSKGECCNINQHEQRAIFLAQDQFYKGTCEADLICAEGGTASPQAKPCGDGFVCDEATSLESSTIYHCPAGFVCESATTPDTDLQAPGSQLLRLCKEGYFCGSDESKSSGGNVCPSNYFCPAGTHDPLVGSLANDGLLRMFGGTDSTPHANIQYYGGDSFALLNDHERDCKAATLPSLQDRFQAETKEKSNVNYLEYLADHSEWPVAVNEAKLIEEQCVARDSKSAYVHDAMRRRECNCHSQFFTLAMVYRFWLCTSDSPLDDLGLGDAAVPLSGNGKREFWYPRSRIHLDLESAIATDPAMQVFGLQYGEGNVCKFSDSDEVLTLTQGRLRDEEDLPAVSALPSHSTDYLDLSTNEDFLVRFTSVESRMFKSYSSLKQEVTAEYDNERYQLSNGERSNIDLFLFDLYHSIKLIEQFGRQLESFVRLTATARSSTNSIEIVFAQGNDTYAQEFDFEGPIDWCDCQHLLRCPNGTISDEGSTSQSDCESTKSEVLHRISILPPINKNMTVETPSTEEGTVDESTTLQLDPFDVAILTVDQSALPNNLIYGEHYQISIYDGCKPCPLRYQCKKDGRDVDAQSPACNYPSNERQVEILNECLMRSERKKVCFHADGTPEDVEKCESIERGQDGKESSDSIILFSEPDLDKCLSRTYFCSNSSWNYRSFRKLCQDTKQDGSVTPIYDCADVHRWRTYTEWRNGVCCASQVPELRDIDSCTKNACADDPLIEQIIREKLIGVFELEHGYIPPIEEPKGQLVMNASLQEDLEHDQPLELFNEWQEPFNKGANAAKASLHNIYKPEASQTWMSTHGCCKCQRHPMPAFFADNAHVSGYPDDKHQPIQIAISAIASIELTVVVELLHGAYYAEFSAYYGPRDKTFVRVHTPTRIAEDSDQATWLAVMDQTKFDKFNLDLPFNLPSRIGEGGSKTMENRFLVDRPVNITIGDKGLADILGADDQHIGMPSTSDSIYLVIEDDTWWPNDFMALPYLPFFSNCNGYDSHISLSRLLEEHPDCQSVPYDQTVPTKEYAFQGKHPVSDECLGVVLQCTYEEKVREARKNLRWFEASPGSALFHIVSYNMFESSLFNLGRRFLIILNPFNMTIIFHFDHSIDKGCC